MKPRACEMDGCRYEPELSPRHPITVATIRVSTFCGGHVRSCLSLDEARGLHAELGAAIREAERVELALAGEPTAQQILRELHCGL